MKADYSDHVSIVVEVRRSRSDALEATIVELSGGKAEIERL